MHQEKPAVYRLHVHLPDEQTITWDAQAEPNVQAVVDRAAEKDTVLTAYFKANTTLDGTPDLFYQDFPSKFVWVESQKKWKVRQRDFAIGRMYYAHPTSGERFYLHLLLTAVKRAASFNALCTVNGALHGTFKQACIARGLLEDDQEWIQCLQEASAMQTGLQFRYLFTIIIRDCGPAQPELLWERFKEHICDDLQHTLRRRGIEAPTEQQAHDYGLYMITKILKLRGTSLLPCLCLSKTGTSS